MAEKFEIIELETEKKPEIKPDSKSLCKTHTEALERHEVQIYQIDTAVKNLTYKISGFTAGLVVAVLEVLKYLKG